MKKYKPTRFMAKDSHYDKKLADKAVRFIEGLKHTTGEWDNKPFVLLEWQEQIIRDIFGIVNKDGYRQFTTAYIEIPKKNGKSELAAAVALKLLCADGESGAQVYGCAADRDQASIVFNVAKEMTEKNPALTKNTKILDSRKIIQYPNTNSFYKVLSAEVKTKHGLNVHGVVFDELHAQPNRKLYDVMTKGSGDARKQPLYFIITTAGDSTQSIGFEIHQKALDIIEGRKHDPTFYPVIYGAKMDEDWTSEKVWKKSNPSLGTTIDISKIRVACNNAKENPAEENTFRQLRLNQWVTQKTKWISTIKYDVCKKDFTEEMLIGRECYGGLDLSSTYDITAFSLIFPVEEDEDEKYYILPYFWIPEDTVPQRVKTDSVNYDIWVRQGILQTTEGNVIHYKFIEEFIKKLSEKFNIKEIAFDRWGATQFSQDLEYDGFNVIPFGQGFRDMSPAIKDYERLIMEQKIVHNGNPILRWMFENLVIRKDPAGNIKFDKEKAKEKIDGQVATVMALDRALRSKYENPVSVYDERGLMVF